MLGKEKRKELMQSNIGLMLMVINTVIGVVGYMLVNSIRRLVGGI
jgi:hypothetical protein